MEKNQLDYGIIIGLLNKLVCTFISTLWKILIVLKLYVKRIFLD